MAPITSPQNEPRQYHRHLDTHRRGLDRTKRPKLQHDSSPEPSTVSDDSALAPTADASHVDNDMYMSSEVSESSEEPSDDSGDDDSEMDDAEEDEGDEEHDGEDVVNLRANRGQKPVMRFDKDEMEDIRPFLKDFLPKLKAANEELEAQKQAGTLETAELAQEDGEGDDEEQYIELNLGLGVLEADGENPTKPSDSKDDRTQEEDVLGKLLGREKGDAGVQVVEEREA
ncbi:hypothetical protein K458DRAFT_391593 [Lentithecium fluviatile CBS 122367]|uniref:Histone chaperone domain-containing protein n=1 Tax=Lentithecium fluviatile CBS 122367 TaxID=1168545 RepID=A0A6G1ITQ6_9PLEO|nr:hypothetical protein K458DRAFT_391593 [Lentithecium fluviatile CBS 122367]